MADITISNLNSLAPSTNTYVPISNGATTGKALYNPVPVGGIIMWSGAVVNIPSGWALCNGQVVNGQTTPNLVDKFIVGAGSSYNPGNIGGSNTITPTGTVGATTLTTSQIPAHSHSINDPGHTHQPSAAGGHMYGRSGVTNSSMAVGGDRTNYGSSPLTTNTTGITINNTGGGGSHTHTFTGTSQTNLPPYYALAYIMRVY